MSFHLSQCGANSSSASGVNIAAGSGKVSSPAAPSSGSPAGQEQEVIASASQLETAPPVTASTSQEAAFSPIAAGEEGLAEAGIAVFYPFGLDGKSAARSLAMEERPSIRERLPADWSVRPVFSSNGRRFRASISVPGDVDLYGGGEVDGPLRRNGMAIKLWNTDNFCYRKDHAGGIFYSVKLLKFCSAG